MRGPGGQPGAAGGNHALQDYQMQSMLLEQQNKKRLMMARQEQEEMTIPGGGYDIDIPTKQIPKPTMEVGSLRNGITANRHQQRYARPAFLATNINQSSYSCLAVARVCFHRVPQLYQGKTIQLYFDAPQWSGGEGNPRALRSSLPISSLTSYLDKHPELVFVVYRDYDVAAMARDDTENNDGDVMPQVKHTGESLHPTTKALIAAVRIFLKSNQYFSNVARGFQNSELLEAPYLVIYHTRKEMGNFLHTLPEQQKRQFQLLLDYILSDYHDDYATVDALLDRGKITYPYIKYLFKPGDILVEGKDDNIRGVFSKSWLENKTIDGQSRRNKSTKNGESIQCWEIETWSWEFTGVFSRMNCKLLLELDANDPSEKTIADLSLRPLAFMSDGLKALLKRRGETIWKCRIRHFVSYHKEKGRELHHSGDDRYMIDLKTYRELHKSNKPNSTDEAPPDDLGEEAMEKDSPPDATFLYLVPPTIKGYNLKRKKWLELQVDRIAEVVWNKEAFQSLVLDRKTKGLIEALISNQLDAEKSTDLISGKGNGLILLLHGGPGTGKTLTAESVAEIAEKPLYPVTCGDIGTVPEEVEGYLESVLNLGKTWQCIVLLDEADVFLEQRSLEDLRRNALVSAFLRVLEYYDGILVLTSNRVGIFDEAFKSRIQLALHYANLSAYQRVKIWQNFIERLEKLKEENVDFDDLKDHLEQLAENKMNGRQIRNAITTARQYAKWKGESLNYALMKDIIETAGRFDVYIEKLNGGYSQDQLAEDEGLRLSGAA
ncbi:AAA family ATPase [Hyaloscypha sp. PMI_1271]|nr:AAA family ATPase [Hyaloscypha sp. PMI_1271]